MTLFDLAPWTVDCAGTVPAQSVLLNRSFEKTCGLKTGISSSCMGAHAAAERQCAPLVKRADRDHPVDPLDPDEGGQLLPPNGQIA
jgi:hypothetical protein